MDREASDYFPPFIAMDDTLYIGFEGHTQLKPETSMVLDIGDLIRLKGYTCHVTCTAVLGIPIEVSGDQHRPRVELM